MSFIVFVLYHICGIFYFPTINTNCNKYVFSLYINICRDLMTLDDVCVECRQVYKQPLQLWLILLLV